jgi:hypothetical protein
MKKILIEAIDSEPIMKYTFFVVKYLFKIIYKIGKFFILFFFFMFFGWLFSGGGSLPRISQSEKDTQWLTDCALQEQWEKNHQ